MSRMQLLAIVIALFFEKTTSATFREEVRPYRAVYALLESAESGTLDDDIGHR